MKILHAPENIGGMAGVLAREQSKLGHDAKSYSFSSNIYGFNSDIFIKDPNSIFERIKNAINFSINYDIFHFYFGSSLMGTSLKDVKWLSKMGKKIFFYFCGCDIRDEKQTIMNYPISACSKCFPKLCSRNRNKAKIIAEEYGKINFVSTPDLLEFVERSVLLPQVVNFELINKINKEVKHTESNTFIIAHAPTNRLIKGTQYIVDCIDRLKSKGLKIDLMLIENMNHENALRKYKEADIAIDQLLIGSYGLVAAELMALGIPTITYIRDDLLNKYPTVPPLINATPNNLEDIIVYFYENREKLSNYKDQGKKYAYTYHDPTKLAIKCLECYIQ